MEQLIQTLKEQLIEALNLEETTPGDIGDDMPLFGDGLGLDSIDALEIIILLEKNRFLEQIAIYQFSKFLNRGSLRPSINANSHVSQH